MLTFTVYGRPATKGSLRGVVRYRRHRSPSVQLLHDNPRTASWQALVAFAACAARARASRTGVLYPKPVAVAVVLSFLLPRPLNARKRSSTLHPTAAQRDDLDKLQRACFDALTGICWADDAQVVRVVASKRYAQPEERIGVHVQVSGEDEPCPTITSSDTP